MSTKRSHRLVTYLAAASLAVCLLGCEGLGFKGDHSVADVKPPPENAAADASADPAEHQNFPDLVEQMLATRQTLLASREYYFEQLSALERAYLLGGDTIKANWARRQRQRLEDVDLDPYPYLTAAPPEHRAEVAPEVQIAEADTVFDEAFALLDNVRGIPAKGLLPRSKKKIRKALRLFKQVLRDYPQSDKVDDCAFYCGEIYKEYLREDDPDNELAIRYYKWAFTLDSETPHAARFQCAAVYDFRRHDRVRALELYRQVLETEEDGNLSNQRFAATRIQQLTDDEFSHLRPRLTPSTPTGSVTTVGDNRAESPVTANIQGDTPDGTEPGPSP